MTPTDPGAVPHASLRAHGTGDRTAIQALAAAGLASKTSGARFRDTEVLRVRDSRIVRVEVDFGWNL